MIFTAQIIDYISLLFLAFFLFPLLRNKLTGLRQKAVIKRIEQDRDSQVITLIHRQIGMGFLSSLFSKHIDIEDSEQILRAIRQADKNEPIDLIVHTPGGLVLASAQIAQALEKHQGKVTVMVPHYAMSGGTYLALAADEILMDEDAILGRVDPQVLGGFPAISIQKVLEKKDINEIDDRTVMLADVSGKALKQTESLIRKLLHNKDFEKGKIDKIVEELISGKYTHDFPLTYQQADEIGLKVKKGLPKLVYKLLKIYGQGQRQQNSAVKYLQKTQED